ncbi:uncharacterized protein LOC117291146 isoform X2 [Asterias rubens]|uniref:uncharacterized protein LOC117291146 isoform X2 n=1 Tax=Asterias rubens TaxID=7604 RepID=UPI0014555B85|nr:uncharacterized protein LOC117291146 isoform X2 [Asterias rubens]
MLLSRNSAMKSTSGVKKQRTQVGVERSKPSQASLISRGLAVKSTHVRCNGDDCSSPPSVQSGFSLYSSDSTDNTAVDVNRGLNRCSKLLANMLDTDQGGPVEIGRATYKHQTQRPKTTSKARKSVSSAQESKLTQGSRKKPGQNVKTSSHTNKSSAKNHRRKDAPTSSTSVSTQAKRRGVETAEASRKGLSSVHVIPTGSSSSAERSGAKLVASVHKLNPRIKSHPSAPGFQDCLMSSTPELRESPSKLGSAESAKSLERNGKPEVQRSANPLRLTKYSVAPTTQEDKVPHKIRGESVEEIPREAEESLAFARFSGSRVLEPDIDYRRRYHQGSVIDKNLYQGHREESYSNLPAQKGEQKVDSMPTYQAMRNGPRSSPTTQHPSLVPVSDQDYIKRVHPPLKNSQDILRDLVQQLTVHNQSHKHSDVNTQDLLQGLIQDGGGPVQVDRLAEVDRLAVRETEDVNVSTGRHVGEDQLHTNEGSCVKQDTRLDVDQNGDPSLRQLLSDFRKIHPVVSVGRREETSRSVHPVLDPRRVDEGPADRHTPELLRGNDNLVSSEEMKGNEGSPQRVTFLTPSKAQHDENEIVGQGSTPYPHQDGQRIPTVETDMQNLPVEQGISSPRRSSEPLLMDPRGTAIRQRAMQQITTMKYLIRELQAVLADHGDLEVNRLLGEIDETCNTLPYTTQKQLLDLNTEVLLAFQPLQSENSQLRRRLRIVNHQLKRRETIEKDKTDAATVSLELLTTQALNANLQKQLREERREKEELLKSKLELSKTLDEKEQQHKDMLRIMDDKDTNLLKSRQDCIKELQELRSARTDLQSRVGYLELQVEGTNKETKILQLSLDQRDKEITRLKNLTQSLHEQLRKLPQPGNEVASSLKTLDGISLQRMNRLLMSSPKADKENQPCWSDDQSLSLMQPSKMYQQINTKQTSDPRSDPNPPKNHFAKSPKSPTKKKSPNRHVTFQRSTDDDNLIAKDVSGWARTDTLWKGQQISTGDYAASERSRQHTLDVPHETSSTTEKNLSIWLSPIPEDLDATQLAGASARQLVKGNYVSMREGASQQSEAKTLQDPYQREDDDFVGSIVEQTNKPYDHPVREKSHSASEDNFRPKSDLQSPIRLRPYKYPHEVLSKVETGSVVSDSTMSSVTSQYEAQFQMGLRNLDSEIGKLQASLKYSNFKSL